MLSPAAQENQNSVLRPGLFLSWTLISRKIPFKDECMHLWKYIYAVSRGHEVTTTEAHLPCQQSKGFLEVWWVPQKDQSLSIIPSFTLNLKKPHWVRHTQMHTCPYIHSHRRNVSSGYAHIKCIGWEPLHRAKYFAAEIALVVGVLCIQIQKYKHVAIIDAGNYYQVLGNTVWL